ncbi:MAG: formylglycine-generating enzyme family protein [Muribaculaceae bacterium]|nr:formylglycine-generating enzyme family protein [Muribaculaceae bacterium]
MIGNNFAGALEKYNLLSENLRVPVFEKIDSRTFTVKGISFTMVGVQGGTFTMGATAEQGGEADSDEKPAHQVIVSSFAIGQTEVTQELWEAVMGSNPNNWKGSKLPVEEVSWDDCQEFIKKLNALTGQNFRLPTEAEWEYAARGGSQSRGYKYSGSNTIDDVAWYDGNSGRQTHDVATKQPNELGLCDMSGNVWEWCQDWYGNYTEGVQVDPAGPTSGSRRVNRGGSWDFSAGCCRVANRNGGDAGRRNDYLGFRLAL